MKQKLEPIEVTGVWLRREGDQAVLLVEVEGEWLIACREALDGGPFSHVVEPAGIASGEPDPETQYAPWEGTA